MREYARDDRLEGLPLFARARTDGHETSRKAAASVPKVTQSHRLLLAQYHRAGLDGLTDEEAARNAGVPDRSCWWKRCGELRAAGLIRPTGKTRIGESGRSRIVCVATGSDTL